MHSHISSLRTYWLSQYLFLRDSITQFWNCFILFCFISHKFLSFQTLNLLSFTCHIITWNIGLNHVNIAIFVWIIKSFWSKFISIHIWCIHNWVCVIGFFFGRWCSTFCVILNYSHTTVTSCWINSPTKLLLRIGPRIHPYLWIVQFILKLLLLLRAHFIHLFLSIFLTAII